MQLLWGLIRFIQLIIFQTFVQANFNAHVNIFLNEWFQIANFDFFGFSGVYLGTDLAFTPAFSEQFEKFGILHMNFLPNTGAFFLFVVLLFAFYLTRIGLNQVLSRLYPHVKFFRMIGMYIYLKNYLLSPLLAFQKLFLEFYFQLTLASFLHFVATVKFFVPQISDRFNFFIGGVIFIILMVFLGQTHHVIKL